MVVQPCSRATQVAVPGADALDAMADADLVALLLGPSAHERRRAAALVARQSSLAALGATIRAHGHDLDPLARLRVLAALELGRRALADKQETPQLLRPHDLVARYRDLGLCDTERLVVVCLGAGRHLVAEHRFHGGLDSVTAPLPLLLRRALESGATGFALVHNHPSGDPRPSAADVAFTARVAAAARLCDLRLYDHVVVAARGWATVPAGAA